MTIYLDSYPIEDRNDACFRYMDSFDWRGISEKVKRDGVIHFEVSDALSLFPHLELDERYALYCYVSRQYHGLWGRVAAVKEDTSPAPINIQKDSPLGPSFELPAAALPPMEVLYNDGSPTGYFEALLAMKLLSALPYTCFEQQRWDECIFFPPAHYKSKWEQYIDLPDWRPRLVQDHREGVSLYACWRHYENGLGSSDGRDQIYLVQHFFYSDLKLYHFFEPKDTLTMYKSRLDEDSRYGEARHCCVASSHEILLTRERART